MSSTAGSIHATNRRLYEIHTCAWLKQLSLDAGRELSLTDVPDEKWEWIARHFDLVWLMGVWQRSKEATRVARSHPQLKEEYRKVRPDWKDDDVLGSPYAVYSYEVDSSLGTSSLASIKKKLNRMGLGLIVDFVPNHLAIDHPWISSHPQWFVCASAEQAARHPDWFFSPESGLHIAHGRDPFFDPWTDTAQVNFFSGGMRQALGQQLCQIAQLADGVRCDMAMLALNEIFQNTWASVLGGVDPPTSEFWEDIIDTVRARYPRFLFIAEAYWGKEVDLLRLGFDFAYDKELYDHLRFDSAHRIREHLKANIANASQRVRFVENHDEVRAATGFDSSRHKCAAVAISTLPGLSLFHEGQMEGRGLRRPIQLVSPLEEAANFEIAAFYSRLFATIRFEPDGDWRWWLLDVIPQDKESRDAQSILAWLWGGQGKDLLVILNFSPFPASGVLEMPNGGPPPLHTRILLHEGATAAQVGLSMTDWPRIAVRLDPWEGVVVSNERQ